MKICQGVSFLLTIFLLGTISFNPAYAHRFYVALVIPFSNAVADQGRQYRQGFMLATTERDSHPDEESDGHLGGLDVYVSVIDSQGDIRTEMERIVSQGRIDIVVAIGSEKTLSLVANLLDGGNIALLLPGHTPFSQSDMPAVVGFMSAFENQYGGRPSAQAAHGYNAARRIDVAVRTQGGADDAEQLVRIFKRTESGFNW
ncbi:MAG: hypothetical protein O6932_05290 [Gammaproteobacteria bacterium]|nr:hypothetical protein [Gammaproteobacteria bacterium]